MGGLKTTRTKRSVDAFLKSIDDPDLVRDCRAVVEIMRKVTGAAPEMWGPSLIGFGSYHYVYDSGREGDWFMTGVSPRSRNLTLYIVPGFAEYADLLGRLGKFTTGKACLYIRKLEDVDTAVLTDLIRLSVRHISRRHG